MCNIIIPKLFSRQPHTYNTSLSQIKSIMKTALFHLTNISTSHDKNKWKPTHNFNVKMMKIPD